MIPMKESYERLPIGFWLRTTGWRQIDPAKFTVENWERDWTDGGSTVWKATPIFLFVRGNIPKIRVSYFIVAALISGSIPKLPDDGLLKMFPSTSTIEDPNSRANLGWDGIGWLIDVWFWESNHVTGRF